MGSSRNRRKRMEAKRRREEQRRRRTLLAAVGGAEGMKVVPRPSGLPKMSDTLVAFAQPLLDTLPPEAGTREYESVLLVAATVWNFLVLCDRREDAATDAKLEEIVYDLANATGNSVPVVIAMLEELAKRKEELFPDEDRIVARVHAEQRGDRMHVTALSAMPAR